MIKPTKEALKLAEELHEQWATLEVVAFALDRFRAEGVEAARNGGERAGILKALRACGAGGGNWVDAEQRIRRLLDKQP